MRPAPATIDFLNIFSKLGLLRGFAALGLMGGLVGCAVPQGGPRITSACGAFTPNPYLPHDPSRNISSISPDPCPISVLVKWNAPANCKLTGGKVIIYLVQNGREHYCGTRVLNAQGPSDPNYQTVTVYVPLHGKPYTGFHDVRRYVTGSFSDGRAADPQSDIDFPNPSGCLQFARKFQHSRSHQYRQ